VSGATANRDRLEELLQAAVELELATIPPYLCALYSLRPEANAAARLVLRSVVVEEMLHAILAANVLNAIGGRPVVGGPDHTPGYPHELPSGVVLDLLPFCPEALDSFLRVEDPEYPHTGLPDDHARVAGRRPQRYQAAVTRTGPSSIGAFYNEILEALEAGGDALFVGEPGRQIGSEYYYAGGGSIVPVHDLTSAREALSEVINQGEGSPTTRFDASGDLAHYFRFEQLARGRAYTSADTEVDPSGPPLAVDWEAVFPMVANPVRGDLTDPELQAVGDRADQAWSLALQQVDVACNGRPDTLVPAVHSMFRLRDLICTLLASPLPDDPDHHAGPSFAWNLPEE
jgi:Ferritin-like